MHGEVEGVSGLFGGIIFCPGNVELGIFESVVSSLGVFPTLFNIFDPLGD
jgi:hypothetical protein